MPRFVLAAVLSLTTVLAGCDEQQADQAPSAEATPVELSKVGQRDLVRTVRAIAYLEAAEQARIRPEVAGLITEVHFREGEEIQRDQELFTIDAQKARGRKAAQRAALAGARSELADARKDRQRQQTLYESGAAAEAQYDQAVYRVQQAAARVERLKAELALARRTVQDTTIEAPMAGRITESAVDPGTYVRIGTELATIYRTDSLEASFRIPERFASELALGQEVRARVAAYANEQFGGTLSYLSPAISRQTLDLRVKARLEDASGRLRPGMTGTAEVVLERHDDQPVVPEEALVPTRAGYLLFVVDDDDVAHAREVEIGLREPGWVEITEGVEVGETVVRAGHQRLADGDRVRATGEDEERPTAAQRNDAGEVAGR